MNRLLPAASPQSSRNIEIITFRPHNDLN